jgi:pimeloyl-ACP methyl ester carboxylesterase
LPESETLNAAIAALRSGDKARAAAILVPLVKENPSSEQGWYLLGMSVAAAEKQEYCYRRVLAINPNHQDARKRLALLSRPAAVPDPLARLSHLDPQAKTETQAASVAPSASEDLKQDSSEKEAQVFHSPNPTNKTGRKKQKRNSNRIVLFSLLGALLSGVCIFSLAFVFFPDVFRQFLSPVPAAQPAVLTITETSTPQVVNTNTPVPTSTPTSIPIPSAAPTVAYIPRFEETTCAFETPEGVNVSCGYAIVPEDRSVGMSKTIRLSVAVFHSTSENPEPDPVMFLQGGPGAEAVQLSANAFEYLPLPFLSKRDYVTFDQRGTGLSEPALKCDELDKVYRQDIYGTIPDDTRELVYKNAFFSCGGVLQVNGIELNSYTTVESAADIKDILQLLGYEKANLYGASYGTRLALVTMRNHPEVVKTAILDSVVPVEANVFSLYPDTVNAALDQLFITCAVDIKCNTAYPDLKTVFWDLVQELDINPVTVTTSAYPMGTVTESVDGSLLLSVVLGAIKNTQFIDTAPQTIYRVKEGDYSTLIAAQYSLPYAFDGINAGLYISMMCHEHGLAATADELRIAGERLGIEHIWRPFYGSAEDMYAACTSWGVSGPYLNENTAVSSDIPSLIIEGSYDPATPPMFGKQVAAELPNSFYFEFHNQGHGPTGGDSTGCAMQIATAFLDNPLIEPDRACMGNLPVIEYLVPYTGDPALQLDEKRVSGVTVAVPEDWYPTDDGFFVRSSSAFDITQAGSFRSDLTVEELKDYFSSSSNGYRGLDGAPIEDGTRSAHGFTWKLYIATFNGRPVDIAMAQDGNEALVVMMFSHPDEHDALYRTVFLPMVDSAR